MTLLIMMDKWLVFYASSKVEGGSKMDVIVMDAGPQHGLRMECV
jgi:hypothetical protein